MAIYVNGQVVAPALIAEEMSRLEAQEAFRGLVAESHRQSPLRRCAEKVAVERTIIMQVAAKDPRPIRRETIQSEVLRQRTAAGCRAAFDDTRLWREVESQMRVHRLIGELTAGAERVSRRDLETYYATNQSQFHVAPLFESAHIICNVNERQSENEAFGKITAALIELEAGEPFAIVVERYSDCRGNGGVLPPCASGEMVDEYECAVHCLEPGQRTDVFRRHLDFT